MIEAPAERRDMDALLDHLLAFARDMLRKQGSVFPFGAVTKTDGRMALVAGSGGQQGSTEDLMGLVVAGMHEQAVAGEIRAAGVCYEVHVPTDDGSTTDAIAVALEDVLGGTALVFMPYSKGGLLKGVRFDEITVSPGEARVFAGVGPG